jgi:NADH-quinone oxidoreductase subunit E
MDNDRIDQIIGKYDGKASSVIQVLLEIQSENHWLPQRILERVGGRLKVPMNTMQHLATFHKAFSLVPPGRHEVHICDGTTCHIRGSHRILDKVQELTGVAPGETGPGMRFSVKTVSCMGRCQSGALVAIDGEHHERVTPAATEEILKKCD